LRHGLGTAILLSVLAVVPGPARAGQGKTRQTLPYDHIHLSVPDPAAATAWYAAHLGGTPIDEGPNRLIFGSTRMLFTPRANAEPSRNGAIDHIGFSVRDLDATMREFEADGVEIEGPVRDVPGLFRLAFVVDPWGTRIELVEDSELQGLHHLHLRAPDPEATLSWFQETFGGERDRLKGQLDGLRYSAADYSTVWILVEQGDALPSQGRAIDHLGWRSTELAADIETFRGQGVTIQSEPRTLNMPNGPPIDFSFVMGPNETRIEVVERSGVPPGR
jgi:lactoylglutathione lyase